MPNQRKRERRIRAHERLERQLASGVKPAGFGAHIALDAHDRDRINGQLRTLEGRLFGRPITDSGPRPWSETMGADPAAEMAERLHHG